jgi:uncharacterized protein (DUF433 family)
MNAVIEEAERLISRMSPGEKAQVSEWLKHEITGQFPGVESNAGVCGGDPCIAGHRIPVWLIWGYHLDGKSDADILQNYPSITAQDLANALGYARAHRDETERLIADNEADDDDDEE